MGRGDVLAGRAYVALMLRDSAFVKGLKSASRQLQSFGGGLATLGGAIAGAGATLLAPLTLAVNKFVNVGSALTDMSGRTGIATSDLAELGYAARQADADLTDVEASARKMQKTIGASKNGIVEIGDAFVDMNGLNPAEQFNKAADSISRIKDPTKKAAAAMDIFGKSGTKLLPMIDALSASRQKFRDLGLAPSEQDIANADELGDAFQDLKEIFDAGSFNIGAALFEPLRDASTIVKNVMVSVNQWIKQNGELFRTIAMVGAGVTIAGAAITAVGLTISAVGLALGGIASVVSVVLSPLGLLTAALAGGAIAWAKYTQSGQAFMGFLGKLGATFKATFGGIVDALQAGELALAGKIAFAGLKVALLQAVVGIKDAVGGQIGDFLGSIGSKLANGDLAGVWETVIDGLRMAWTSFTEGIVATFVNACNRIIAAWKQVVVKAAGGALSKSARGDSFMTALVGQDMRSLDAEALRSRDEMAGRMLEANEKWRKRIEDVNAKMKPGKDRDRAIQEAESAIQANQAVLDQNMNSPLPSQDAVGGIGKIVDSWTAPATSFLKSATEESRRNTAEALDKLRRSTAGGSGQADNSLSDSKKELGKLIADAERLRRDRDNDKAKNKPDVGGIGDIGASRQELIGSFSAAALAAQGQSSMQPVVSRLDGLLRKEEEIRKLNEKLLMEVQMRGAIA
ncbi:MAG: hypothetical protein K8T91_21400 [Planctomycetes bacterium]|nr:hypothetical protein [Planctomycetota bacterium]